jgi:hypothetical protein
MKKWLKYVTCLRIVFPNRQIFMISSNRIANNIKMHPFSQKLSYVKLAYISHEKTLLVLCVCVCVCV